MTLFGSCSALCPAGRGKRDPGRVHRGSGVEGGRIPGGHLGDRVEISLRAVLETDTGGGHNGHGRYQRSWR